MTCYYAILTNAKDAPKKAATSTTEPPEGLMGPIGQKKKSRPDGIWRSTETGSKIFISSKTGVIRAGGPRGKIIDKAEGDDKYGPDLEKKVERRATDLGLKTNVKFPIGKPYSVLNITDDSGKVVFSDYAFHNRDRQKHYTSANEFLGFEEMYRNTPPDFKTSSGQPAAAVNNILKHSIESADEETIPQMFDMIHHSQKPALAARLKHYKPKLTDFIDEQLERKGKVSPPKPTSYKANVKAGIMLPTMKTRKPTMNQIPLCNIVEKLIEEGFITENNCGVAKGGFQRGNKCQKGGSGSSGGPGAVGKGVKGAVTTKGTKQRSAKEIGAIREGEQRVGSKEDPKIINPNRMNTGKRFVPPGTTSDKVTKNPVEVFSPDPFEIDHATGITKTARVGVPGDSVPVPPKIGRLPNLTNHERAVEEEFASAYEKNPEKMSNDFLSDVYKRTKPGGVPQFGTDDAKVLSNTWDNPKLTLGQRSMNRASLNVALHQTANAIAKKAFLKHLDSLEPGDEVMVTVGGCGAGKGYALGKVDQAIEMKAGTKAVWDSAGDQNGTENPWIQRELEKRGLVGNYLYVHADPEVHWADPNMGVVKRAQDPKDGRMVDARVFAESYAIGARNHAAFMEKHKGNPNAKFMTLRTGKKPELIDGLPDDAMVDVNHLHRFAMQIVEDQKDKLPPHVVRGATIGSRIWPKKKK